MLLNAMSIEFSPGDCFYTYLRGTVTKNKISAVNVTIDYDGTSVSYTDSDGRYHQQDQAYTTPEEAFRLGELK